MYQEGWNNITYHLKGKRKTIVTDSTEGTTMDEFTEETK